MLAISAVLAAIVTLFIKEDLRRSNRRKQVRQDLIKVLSLPDPLSAEVARLTKTGLNVEELIEEFEKQGEAPGLFAISRVVDMPGYYEAEEETPT